MSCTRIIPRLDIKGPHLVKGIHLEGLRVLGKPEDYARYYYENGADELIYMDVVASLYGRNSLHDIILKTAKEIFIPLTVGGGIRTLDDIKNVLRSGADKVALNTAAIKNPEFIKSASRRFGSSTIVVAIEAIKEPDTGNYLAFVDNGREYTGVDVFEWAQRVTELGAGELIITSVDREGTGLGYDIELVKKIADMVNIPIIAHGGPGKLEHISELITETKISGVCISSILHYHYIKNHKINIDTSLEGNVEFLKSGKANSMLKDFSINEIKQYLNSIEVICRI